jgi:hypothetical protein
MTRPAIALRLLVVLALAAALAGCLPIGIKGSTQLAGADRAAPATVPVR